MAILELDIAPRTKGRASAPLSIQHVRDLEPSDLALLASERGIAPTPIKQLRDRHHALARCLAEGFSNTEASVITGYDPSRISILKNDPAFQALITDYRKMTQAVAADFVERTSLLSISVVNRLQEVVDEDDELSPSTLLEIGKFAADRSGNAPVTRTLNANVNVNFGSRLKAARERASQHRLLSSPGGDIIDAEFSEAGT